MGCYTNQVAASALFAERWQNGHIIRQWQPSAEVQQPDTSSGERLPASWGGDYHHGELPPLALSSQLQVQDCFAHAGCSMKRAPSPLSLGEPPPPSNTTLKNKLGNKKEPGFCVLDVRVGSGGFIKSLWIDLHRSGKCLYVCWKKLPSFLLNAWMLCTTPIWEIYTPPINNS